MKIKIEPNDANVQGAKRQHVPFSLRWACPKCGANNIDDLSKDAYLCEPVFNGTTPFNLYCHHCGDFEKKVTLFLTIDLSFRCLCRLTCDRS